MSTINIIFTYIFRILKHCKHRGMPSNNSDLRDVVTADIETQQAQNLDEYANKYLKYTTSKAWYKRFDWNLYKVWRRKKVGRSFVRERFYCSNTLFLKFMKRRVDMKALTKRFSGFQYGYFYCYYYLSAMATI